MKRKEKKVWFTLSNKAIPPKVLKAFYVTYPDVVKSAKKAESYAICLQVGRRLQGDRILKGYTLEEVAERSQVPLIVAEDVEAGNPLLGAHAAVWMADALGIEGQEFKDLFNFKGPV